MSEPETITLRDVRRLDLNAGEVLVVLLEDRSPHPDAVRVITEVLGEQFPGHKFLVLAGGVDLAVVRS